MVSNNVFYAKNQGFLRLNLLLNISFYEHLVPKANLKMD